MSEWATLLPSPTKARRTPVRRLKRRRRVSRSASAWHGCSASVSAFTTGTDAAAAISVSVACAKVRSTIASTSRDRLRATSAALSRRPRPTSSGPSAIAWPPRPVTATSKLTRVRRLGFSNRSATCRPSSGRAGPMACRSLRSSSARSRRRTRPSPSRSAAPSRCRGGAAAASRGSRDLGGHAAARASASAAPRRSIATVDLVGADRQRRHQADRAVAGGVDEQAVAIARRRHRLAGDRPGRLEADHEAATADLGEHALGDEGRQAVAQLGAAGTRVGHQVQLVDDARAWPAPRRTRRDCRPASSRGRRP